VFLQKSWVLSWWNCVSPEKLSAVCFGEWILGDGYSVPIQVFCFKIVLPKSSYHIYVISDNPIQVFCFKIVLPKLGYHIYVSSNNPIQLCYFKILLSFILYLLENCFSTTLKWMIFFYSNFKFWWYSIWSFWYFFAASSSTSIWLMGWDAILVLDLFLYIDWFYWDIYNPFCCY
jgi:hypothetical protein